MSQAICILNIPYNSDCHSYFRDDKLELEPLILQHILLHA